MSEELCVCGHSKFWHTPKDVPYKNSNKIMIPKGCDHKIDYGIGRCKCEKFRKEVIYNPKLFEELMKRCK